MDRVILWDVSRGRAMHVMDAHTRDDRGKKHDSWCSIFSLAFDPAGQLLASGGDDETARIWSTETGKLLKTLKGHKYSVRGISFSSDGKLLATLDNQEGVIRVWETQSWALFGTIPISSQKKGWALTFHSAAPIIVAVTGEQGELVQSWQL